MNDWIGLNNFLFIFSLIWFKQIWRLKRRWNLAVVAGRVSNIIFLLLVRISCNNFSDYLTWLIYYFYFVSSLYFIFISALFHNTTNQNQNANKSKNWYYDAPNYSSRVMSDWCVTIIVIIMASCWDNNKTWSKVAYITISWDRDIYWSICWSNIRCSNRAASRRTISRFKISLIYI